MQPAHNKLKEIIWELTSRCNNDCDYCGSKEYTCLPNPDNELINHILKSISEYPPEEVNISGGDPLLLSREVHENIVDTLENVGCTVKIIVNPKSLITNKFEVRLDNTEKTDLYEVVGLSINTKDELERVKRTFNGLGLKNKCTIITNFNTDNIWNYREIEQFVQANNLCWQIQYTMCIDGKAIYDNEEAKKHLFKNIAVSKASGVKVVLSDNMNKGKCFAGQAGLGIMSDGEVLPCLSMRGWAREGQLFQSVIGDLRKTSLKYIWTTGFASFRCNEFMCCKDICNAPYEEVQPEKIDVNKINKNLFKLMDIPTTDGPILNEPVPKIVPDDWNRVFAYGVVQPERWVKPYITPSDYPITIMYGVFKDGTAGGTTWTTTTSASIGTRLSEAVRKCE